MCKKEHIIKAYELAEKALGEGEIPVGAIVVENGMVIGEGHNRQLQDNDPTAHAEIIALRNAGSLKNNFRLDDSEMFVTIEPCDMCKGAIKRARIKKVYYASCKARPATHITEYMEMKEYKSQSNKIIKEFFKDKR